VRWDDFRSSGNIEDRRGMGGGAVGGLGLGTVVILGLIGWALGIDPRLLIGGAEMVTGGRSGYEQRQSAPTGTPSDEMGRFVAAVLGDTEDRWKELFQQAGSTYREPRLVMFSGATSSACGHAQSAMGPFYCPSDQRVYLDSSFFRDIEQRFRGCSGKSCQFAQAYVIAHEIGHHVQNQMGILAKVQQAQQGRDRVSANRLQVRLELQADCFAGIWANRAQAKWSFIEPGDVEAALQTAAAIGDDRLQKQSQGRVVPDAFTHGSSEQRVHWFTQGLKAGSISACNTFQDPGV
jgi:uncharacterized protein